MKKTLSILFLLSSVLSGISSQNFAQVTDSTDQHGNQIKTFGQDSIYKYTKEHKLFEINYLDTSSIINSITFKDDEIHIIRYNSQNTPDALSEEYFENGIITTRWYAKDSIIVSMGHPVHCHSAYVNYYPNGKIESTGQQGFVGSKETSVGLHKKYRKTGQLLLSEDFIYPKKAIEENQDSEFLSYVIVREYYLSERLHSRKIYSNYVWYETDHPDDDESDEYKRRLGIWAYYDERDSYIFAMKKYSNLNEKTGENTPCDETNFDNSEIPVMLELFNLSINVDARDKMRRTALMAAIEIGNTEEIHALIERNANVNAYDYNGHNVLYYACLNGQLKTVELLLSKGAEFSHPIYSRRNAIFPAIERGYADIVKCLVEAGCSLEVYTNRDATPLITAVTHGHYEIAKYLLEQGAKANLSNYNNSPLNIAASVGNIQLIELFLDHIKEDAKWDEFISVALSHASNNGQIDAVKHLLATNAQVSEPQDYLQEAVISGQAQSAAFWIDQGADANAFYLNSWLRSPKSTLVMKAANYGYTDVVKVLVTRGATINSEIMELAAAFGDSEMIHFLLANGMKTTPNLLILAAGNLKTENVRTLLALGLKADSRNRLKRTPMMEAALYYYDEMSGELSFPEILKRVYEISKLLIENGANVNARDYEGMTALMFAVNGGHTETVKLLLSKGAQLDDSNKLGDKVTDLCCLYYPEGLDTVLLDILKIKYTDKDIENGYLSDRPETKWKNQEEKNDVLRQAIHADNPKEVKQALDAGAAIDYYNSYADEVPIGEALDRGNSIAVLRLLIQYGAPVNATNYNGTTPLMRAVMARDYSAVKYFIKCGADINQKNVYNNAALIFAAQNGDLRIIRLLVKNGADVNTEGNWCTPLSKAREYKHDKAAELLISLGAIEEVKLLE